MHAILFQMALLPLTMARSTVAYLSQTYIGRKYIPLHKVVAMHVHLGYVMVGFVFGSTILFFVFFGQGCVQQKTGKEPSPNGVKTFCKKMQSEIMITGLTIMGCLLLLLTSYWSNVQPRFGIRSDAFKSNISIKKKTLRFFRFSESSGSLPHPHNRLVVGSSPTGPTIY